MGVGDFEITPPISKNARCAEKTCLALYFVHVRRRTLFFYLEKKHTRVTHVSFHRTSLTHAFCKNNVLFGVFACFFTFDFLSRNMSLVGKRVVIGKEEQVGRLLYTNRDYLLGKGVAVVFLEEGKRFWIGPNAAIGKAPASAEGSSTKINESTLDKLCESARLAVLNSLHHDYTATQQVMERALTVVQDELHESFTHVLTHELQAALFSSATSEEAWSTIQRILQTLLLMGTHSFCASIHSTVVPTHAPVGDLSHLHLRELASLRLSGSPPTAGLGSTISGKVPVGSTSVAAESLIDVTAAPIGKAFGSDDRFGALTNKMLGPNTPFANGLVELMRQRKQASFGDLKSDFQQAALEQVMRTDATILKGVQDASTPDDKLERFHNTFREPPVFSTERVATFLNNVATPAWYRSRQTTCMLFGKKNADKEERVSGAVVFSPKVHGFLLRMLAKGDHVCWFNGGDSHEGRVEGPSTSSDTVGVGVVVTDIDSNTRHTVKMGQIHDIVRHHSLFATAKAGHGRVDRTDHTSGVALHAPESDVAEHFWQMSLAKAWICVCDSVLKERRVLPESSPVSSAYLRASGYTNTATTGNDVSARAEALAIEFSSMTAVLDQAAKIAETPLLLQGTDGTVQGSRFLADDAWLACNVRSALNAITDNRVVLYGAITHDAAFIGQLNARVSAGTNMVAAGTIEESGEYVWPGTNPTLVSGTVFAYALGADILHVDIRGKIHTIPLECVVQIAHTAHVNERTLVLPSSRWDHTPSRAFAMLQKANELRDLPEVRAYIEALPARMTHRRSFRRMRDELPPIVFSALGNSPLIEDVLCRCMVAFACEYTQSYPNARVCVTPSADLQALATFANRVRSFRVGILVEVVPDVHLQKQLTREHIHQQVHKVRVITNMPSSLAKETVRSLITNVNSKTLDARVFWKNAETHVRGKLLRPNVEATRSDSRVFWKSISTSARDSLLSLNLFEEHGETETDVQCCMTARLQMTDGELKWLD